MSAPTLADAYDVNEVYRTRRRPVVHLNDECESINEGVELLPSDAAAIPDGYYNICKHCDPSHQIDYDNSSEKEGWPV